MKKTIIAALFAIAIGFAASASAQEGGVVIIQKMKGSVLVNQGVNFNPASQNQSLRAGDRLMTTANSSATLDFGNGCTTEVKAGTMVTIPDRSICDGGQLVTQSLEPGTGTAPGAGNTTTGRLGATGTGNAGITTLSVLALAIAIYEISKSP